jgi:hypothetical protein
MALLHQKPAMEWQLWHIFEAVNHVIPFFRGGAHAPQAPPPLALPPAAPNSPRADAARHMRGKPSNSEGRPRPRDTASGGSASVSATCTRIRGACSALALRRLPTTSPSHGVRWSLGVSVIRTRGLVSVRCARRATTARPRSTSPADGQPNASSRLGRELATRQGPLPLPRVQDHHARPDPSPLHTEQQRSRDHPVRLPQLLP